MAADCKVAKHSCFARCGAWSIGKIVVPNDRKLPDPAHSRCPAADGGLSSRLQSGNLGNLGLLMSLLGRGDSLTEGWDPVLWERSLAPRSVLNAGIAGDFTDHILRRLEHGNLAGPPLKAVILLIGTNDLAAHRSPELTADGIRAILVLLRARLPQARILLLGLLPREQFPDAPLRRAVTETNRLIRDCADGEHIGYTEIGDALLDSDGRLSVAVSPDWLHFSERGYALLESSLEHVLDRVLAGDDSCCQPR